MLTYPKRFPPAKELSEVGRERREFGEEGEGEEDGGEGEGGERRGRKEREEKFKVDDDDCV